MAAKVFKSTLSWRTLENQDSVLAPIVPGWPDVPVYTDDDFEELVRPTRRKTVDDLYMASLAVLAKEEAAFKKRMRILIERFHIHAVEDETSWLGKSGNAAVVAWRTARKKDAGSHGGKISADKKKMETKAAIDLIRDRWPMPSNKWPTKALLKEADISLNTAKAHLGKRPIAQYNYQAKLKRAEGRKLQLPVKS